VQSTLFEKMRSSSMMRSTIDHLDVRRDLQHPHTAFSISATACCRHTLKLQRSEIFGVGDPTPQICNLALAAAIADEID